ncbi:proline-rich protein 36 [Oryzias melastigma]|uniref:Si:ch73-290k24.6 n=1 Tax=Oryzias melastigma TaxID=30732 RepID=A0A3B3DWN4_ORYME|nr:proline-rich protein 36 [Oryzias melastigma]XP_024144402.1 proline-rich protein 36 [Oryzias melastigma]
MEYHSGGSLPLLGRPRYCPGTNANGEYLCETGHCCGETGCCTYYYELWWFWLLWTVLILFSCCCAYRHRRAKLRVQQQQRQREISLLAYHGANSFPSSMLDLSFLASLKLPSYEEVAAQPSTPPPPYSSVFTTPRYPQPPRAADPHLLTQHDPLLHRPLSDGPSSLSSDNSSSCSCDSCCPSSPCSSSLSAPVTYETDTSHASTPSEATPITLDVTMETITAAVSCLGENKVPFAALGATATADVRDPEAAGAEEPQAKKSPPPLKTVTVAVVTRAASPQLLPSPGPELALPIGTISPTMQQLDIALRSPVVAGSSFSCSTIAEAVPPSIQVISVDSIAPTDNPSDGSRGVRALENLTLTRTFHPASAPCTPTSVPANDVGRTLALNTVSASLASPDQDRGPSTPTKLSHDQEPPLPHPSDPEPTNRGQDSNPQPVLGSFIKPILISKPTHLQISPGLEPANISPPTDSQSPELSSGSGLVCSSPGLYQRSGPDAGSGSLRDLTVVLDLSGLSAVPTEPPEVALVPLLPSEAGLRPSSGSGPTLRSSLVSTPVPAGPEPSSLSCPAITIESEASFCASPLAVLSPSSPRSLACLPAPTLLLDPLTSLNQSDRGGSSGHASSLSPSPRATQSPPKQTVFSPCVDVFEPGPPSFDEEERDERGNEDEDEDMGADESQYRHRRLTGDSGIEVCRCRVEDEDDEEEDEEDKKEESRRGEGVSTDVHDSMDCPARGQMSPAEALTLCTAAPTTTDGGKVVIVMETA